MLRGNTMHACPEISRRSFMATVFGVVVTPNAVVATQSAAPGFHVTDVLTESQERDIFFIGIQFGLIAAPGTAPHRILRSQLGTRVHVHVESA